MKNKHQPNASAEAFLFPVPQGWEMLILIVIFLPLRYYYVITRTQRASGIIRVFPGGRAFANLFTQFYQEVNDV
jgi:hypothetical protein